jgi:citrate lyase beta subunit
MAVGVDPDEVVGFWLPPWVAGENVAAKETSAWLSVVLADLHVKRAGSAERFSHPIRNYVKFVVFAAVADGCGLDAVLIRVRDDEGFRDALRSACALGGAPLVRQVIAAS